MSVTSHDVGLESLDALEGYDALCLFVAEDERPLRGAAGFADWRLCGALSRVLIEKFFTGAEGDSLLLPTSGRFPMGRIFVFGVGPSKKLDAAALGRALERASQTLQKAKVESVALEVPGESVLDEGVRGGAFKAQFLPAFKKAKVAVLGPKSLGRLVSGD